VKVGANVRVRVVLQEVTSVTGGIQSILKYCFPPFFISSFHLFFTITLSFLILPYPSLSFIILPHPSLCFLILPYPSFLGSLLKLRAVTSPLQLLNGFHATIFKLVTLNNHVVKHTMHPSNSRFVLANSNIHFFLRFLRLFPKFLAP
jgi:hypothetical protein